MKPHAAGSRRVMHIVNGEFYAGAERVQDLLALRLGSFGFEVEFACLKGGVFDAQRQARDAVLHALPMKSRFDVAVCRRLAQLVRDQRIALIHTHTPRTALLGMLVARTARVPMVHHVHSPAGSDTESGWRNARNTVAERVSLGAARRLIAVSASLQRHLRQRGFADELIREVPNGVPVCEPRRREYRAGDELVVGTLALFRPRKGMEVLLEALAMLRAQGIRVRLHAVGPFETPEYEQSLKQRVRSLELQGVVDWAGFRSNVADEYARMHVFVLPSLYGEGMPMVVLEAMAAGLPVACTSVAGVPQVVRDGIDGLLTAPGDARELAAALARLASGEADGHAMGDSGRERQRREFSDVSMARAIADVYREVLDA